VWQSRARGHETDAHGCGGMGVNKGMGFWVWGLRYGFMGVWRCRAFLSQHAANRSSYACMGPFVSEGPDGSVAGTSNVSSNDTEKLLDSRSFSSSVSLEVPDGSVA
jgi:hypothetical protein